MKIILCLLCMAAVFFGAILAGGLGDPFLGVLGLFLGAFFFHCAFRRYIDLLLSGYCGAITFYVGAASIYNYRNGIHDCWHDFQMLCQMVPRVHLPEVIVANEKILTISMLLLTMILLLSMREVMETMPLLIWILISAVVGIARYAYTQDVSSGLFLGACMMMVLILLTLFGIVCSTPFQNHCRILTILPLLGPWVSYIHGHFLLEGKKYRERRNLPFEEKKKEVASEIAQFANNLSCGYYLMETHEVLYHLIESNLPQGERIVWVKKFRTLVPGKSKSEFRYIYGEQWEEAHDGRKDYLWLFRIDNR